MKGSRDELAVLNYITYMTSQIWLNIVIWQLEDRNNGARKDGRRYGIADKHVFAATNTYRGNAGNGVFYWVRSVAV
jgi:hypothetical protein